MKEAIEELHVQVNCDNPHYDKFVSLTKYWMLFTYYRDMFVIKY